jgi:2-polyprenyl-3-methyl-5-hydroxy-6-metoxy-1,4-benzoquinol methylase
MHDHPPTANGRTLDAYERCARDYAAEAPTTPTPVVAGELQQLAAAIAPGGHVLEIGSGPGWEADFLESLGVRVHRTDATAAFRAIQAERGKSVDALDLLADEIPGTYDGVLMLFVLQHFERAQADAAVRKLARALNEGGALLLSYLEGEGEVWEHGTSGEYRVVYWPRAAMNACLAQAGLHVERDEPHTDSEGAWRLVLARRPA